MCKRTAFLAAYVFIYLNGWELVAPEAEAVVAVLALAAGEMDEAGFSNWLASNSVVRSALE
jgi:death-on-curing protein